MAVTNKKLRMAEILDIAGLLSQYLEHLDNEDVTNRIIQDLNSKFQTKVFKTQEMKRQKTRSVGSTSGDIE